MKKYCRYVALLCLALLNPMLFGCGGGEGEGGSVASGGGGSTTGTTSWSHQAYLKAPNNSNGDLFGSSVAVDGNTIVIGSAGEASTTTAIINGADLSATNESGSGNGAAYVFTRSGSTWSHQAYLKAPNNSNNYSFGSSVAIAGDTIVVGSNFEASTTTAIINGADLSSTNNFGLNNGAVYVFVRSGTTWTHQAYLKAPNSASGACFGYSVAISGDTIVVGSIFENSTTTAIINDSNLSPTDHSGYENGAAYVFVRSGSIWAHQAYLKAPNNSDGDWFGASVGISGDTIVVGAHSEDSATTAIINGNSLSSTNNSGNANGAAYVFVRSGAIWFHQAYLKAPNNSDGNWFGRSVAISDNTIVIGAQEEGGTTTTIINGDNLSSANNSGSFNGAAYVFIRSGTSWSHQAYLKSPNNSDGDRFGTSVAISGNTIIVGAWGEASNTNTIINGTNLTSSNNSGFENGAAYVFVRSGTSWSHQAYLKALNNSNGDWFGRSVSISDNTIVVGSIFEDSTTMAIINGSNLSSSNDLGSSNGAAYVFVRQ